MMTEDTLPRVSNHKTKRLLKKSVKYLSTFPLIRSKVSSISDYNILIESNIPYILIFSLKIKNGIR